MMRKILGAATLAAIPALTHDMQEEKWKVTLVYDQVLPNVSSKSIRGVAELLAPALRRFMGDDNASISQQQPDIPQAEAEHAVKPDAVADDLGGKAMAIVRVGWRLHATSLAGLKPACQTPLT
jgi:hypothetical protein